MTSKGSTTITVASGLEMPAGEAATQKFGIVGASGSGKSYTARRLVEQLFRAGAPTIILDPIGNWSYLRIAADGVSPGLPIPVIGGMRGDVPLELDRGADLAGALVGADASAVIDLSEFSKGKRKGFVADFVEALFQAARLHLSPIMLVVEEAQLFAPQKPGDGEQRMLGAMTDWCRLARNYGGGSTLITQRPQSVSKEVLNQVECLFVGQLRGPHERKAISEWATETAADNGVSNADLKALPSLEVGEFFCWSPSWLRRFERVRILKTETYDGSKTPQLFKGGMRAPQERAPIDVEALRALMAPKAAPAEEVDSADADAAIAAAGEAKRKRGETDEAYIRRLVEKVKALDIQCSRNARSYDELIEQRRELSDELVELRSKVDGRDQDLEAEVSRLRHELARAGAELGGIAERLREAADAPPAPTPVSTHGTVRLYLPEPTEPTPSPRRANEAASNGHGGLGKCARALLAALVQHGDLSLQQAAIVAQYSPASSIVPKSAGELRTLGLVSGSNARLTATPAGHKHPDVRGVARLPVGRDLAAYWLSRLGKCEEALLRQVLKHHPKPISLEKAAVASDYSPTSSIVPKSAGRLRTLMLVNGSNAALTANERLVS
jgi:uncharacterized protein